MARHQVQWRQQRYPNNCWFTCFQMVTRYYLAGGSSGASRTPTQFQTGFVGLGDQANLNPQFDQPASRNMNDTLARQLGMRTHSFAASYTGTNAAGRVNRTTNGVDARPLSLANLADRAPVVFPCLVPGRGQRMTGHVVVIAGSETVGQDMRFYVLDPASANTVPTGGIPVSLSALFQEYAPWLGAVYSYAH